MNPTLKKLLVPVIRQTGSVLRGKFSESNIPKAQIKKVLFVCLHFRGDVLFTTPAVRAVHEQLGVEVHYLIHRRTRDILIANPHISKLIEYNNLLTGAPDVSFHFGFKERRKFLKQMRSEKYDLIIDFTGSRGATYLINRMGAKYTAGFNYQGLGFLHDREIIWSGKKHLVNEYTDIAEAILDIRIQDRCLELHVQKEHSESVSKYIPANRSGLKVAIHIAAGWAAKEWRLSEWSRLVEMLIDVYHSDIFIIGSKSDAEKANAVASKVSAKSQLHNLTGQLSLAESSALIGRCNLFIGIDSGPLFIAEALGIPAISIFGPTNPRYSAPRDVKRNRLVYQEIDCSPLPDEQYCRLDAGRKCPTHHCIQTITAEMVFEKVASLLNS